MLEDNGSFDKVDVSREAMNRIAVDVIEAFTDMEHGAGRKIIEEVIDIVVAKNADYGDAWQRYGVFTPLIRNNDKTLRVATLSDGRQALVADEKIGDTLRDIIGYALLALLWLEKNG